MAIYEAASTPGSSAGSHADKPYHSKRPHRKSRKGCRTCKARKVKCDEVRPSCTACTLRRETCVYPTTTQLATGSSLASRNRTTSNTPITPTDPFRNQRIDTLSPRSDSSSSTSVVIREPLFIPQDRSEAELQLLWFYGQSTFRSFAAQSGPVDTVNHVLKVKLIEHAFANPFLMNTMLSLTSLHLRHVGIDYLNVPPAKALTYRAQAFETYRRAIEEANPSTYPALVACALFLCGLTTQVFRDEEDYKPFYILDWMNVWQGVGLIMQMTSAETVYNSGLQTIFYRPLIDLNAAAAHIPNCLVFMVASVKEGDPDYRDNPVYYNILRYLGSLYQELKNGFSDVLFMRILTFFSYMPKSFILLARKKRPRALVIIAYYLVFAKMVPIWWFRGVDRDLPHIIEFLGPEWEPLLRVPIQAVPIDSGPCTWMQVAQLLLGDKNWRPPPRIKQEAIKSAPSSPASPAASTSTSTPGAEDFELAWVDNTGKPMPNHLFLDEYDPKAIPVHTGPALVTASPTPPPSGPSEAESPPGQGEEVVIPFRTGVSSPSVLCLR
ncbi:hypothetical protein B0T20DRAFT_60477 [Sordaria brevicollis]|uniref:Zn(2)-C6 fungal-type domain-containing protein n=1 Tax=Sordaria brevicollis TaxID=83679 RepID=A0AAE0P3E4_SORBR|nr:hypothetical protein B0T20DRAFT_60477 [Sordaria brevicollis]